MKQFHRAKSISDMPLESKPLQFKPRQESIFDQHKNSISIKKNRGLSKSKKSKKKLDKRHNKIKRTRSCTNLNSKRRSSKSDKLKSKSSEPCYVIQAHYKNNILAINVNDSSSSNQWRQEFTKDSFQHIKIYKVAKILINSIKKTTKNDSNHKDEKNKSNDECKDIKIFEYNGFCYVTLIDSCLPSFALRPISNNNDDDDDDNEELKEIDEDNEDNDDDKLKTDFRRMAIINTNYNYNNNQLPTNKNTPKQITKWSLPGNFNSYYNQKDNNHLNEYNHFNGYGFRKESNDTLYSNTSWISSSPSIHSNVGYNSGQTSISIDSNISISNNNNNKKQGPGFDYDQNDKNQVIIIHKGHHHKKSLSDTIVDGDYYKHRTMADKENIKYDYV